MKKVVITGGHHSCALPIVAELQKRPSIKIYWFGHKHTLKGDRAVTMEYEDITSRDIPFFTLYAGKFYNTYNLLRLVKIGLGIGHAFLLLLRIRPDLVISFGGYLAVPTVLAAYILGIPSVTHEQTVVCGYANKIIARFTKKVLISWERSKDCFNKNLHHKIFLTGLPLRTEIHVVQTAHYEVNPKLPTIYITGGKTGAHKINAAVFDVLQEFLGNCNIIHQCGDSSVYNDFEHLSARYEQIKHSVPGTYHLRKNIYSAEIGEVFSKATLLISRSGANTVAELLYLRKPAVLVPIPWVSHNEQVENASLLKESGLAVILREEGLTGHTLLKTTQDVLDNLSMYALKRKDLHELVSRNATQAFVAQLQEYL